MDINYDDAQIKKEWCREQRTVISEYLNKEKLKYGSIGEFPSWFVAPYISIWAIHSLLNANSIGWWVIAGDLPTDYISSKNISTPREAIRQFSDNWTELSSLMIQGKNHPSMKINTEENRIELAELLEKRSKILHEWYNDEALW